MKEEQKVWLENLGIAVPVFKLIKEEGKVIIRVSNVAKDIAQQAYIHKQEFVTYWYGKNAGGNRLIDKNKKIVRKYGTYKRKQNCEDCGKIEYIRPAEYDKDGFLIRKAKVRERNYLTIHHLDHNPENNAHSNLRTLCKDCHNKIHAKE